MTSTTESSTTPLFLDVVLPNGDTLYLNLAGVESINIPADAGADAMLKMRSGASFSFAGPHDELLSLINSQGLGLQQSGGLTYDDLIARGMARVRSGPTKAAA